MDAANVVVFQVTHFWFVGTITLIEIVRSLPGAFFIDLGWWVTRCSPLWQGVLGNCACSRFNSGRSSGLKFEVQKKYRNSTYFNGIRNDSDGFQVIPESFNLILI